MTELTVEDRTLAAVFLLLGFFGLGFQGRRALWRRHLSLRGAAARFLANLRWTLQALGCWGSLAGHAGSLEDQHAKRMREDLARHWSASLAMMHSFAALVGGINILMGSSVIDRSTYSSTSLLVLIAIMQAVGFVRPLREGRRKYVVHCVAMAALLVCIIPVNEALHRNFEQRRAAIGLARCALGVMVLKTQVVLVTNAAFSAAVVAAAELRAMQGPAPSETYYVLQEVFTFLIITLVILVLEILLVLQVRHQSRMHFEHGKHSAATALLGLVCDAVVELSDSLCITEGAPKFSNLLFFDKDLRGQPIETFIVNEDRTHFQEGLASETKMLHLRFRDAWGKAVSMQLFYVRFGDGSRTRHLLGLKEHVDFESSRTVARDVVRALAPSAAEAPHGAQPELDLGAKDPKELSPRKLPDPKWSKGAATQDELQQEWDLASANSRDRGRRPNRRRRSRNSRGSPASIEVRVLAQDGLPIVSAGDGWRALYGQATAMADVLPSPSDFSRWLNSMCENVREGKSQPASYHFGLLQLGKGEQQQTMLASAIIGDQPSEVCIMLLHSTTPPSTLSDRSAVSPRRGRDALVVAL